MYICNLVVLRSQQVVVNDEDIRQQENKVEGARKKLEELLAAIEKTNEENLEKEGRPMSADSVKSVSQDKHAVERTGLHGVF